MPATSVAQRRLFAIAEKHPDQLYKKNKGLLNMSQSQMHDYASTPEKGLPKKAPRKKGLLHMTVLLTLLLLGGISPAFAANETDGGAWLLDTVGAITTDYVWVQWIMWSGCTADGHDLVIKDAAGTDYIVNDVDGEAGKTKFYPIYGEFKGFTLTTMGSGKVLVKLWYERN